MKIRIVISLVNSEKSNYFSLDIINMFLPSSTIDYFFNGKTYKWDLKKIAEKFKSSKECNFTYQKNDDFDSIVISDVNRITLYKSIDLTLDFEVYKLNKETFELLLRENSEILISCFVFDHTFYLKQNARRETDLTLYGFHDELKKVKFITTKFGEKVIDNQNNIGKIFFARETFITVAPIMFFGKHFNKIIEINKMVNYPSAKRIKLFENGVLLIELFENIVDSEKAENIDALRKFKEFFQFDSIIKGN